MLFFAANFSEWLPVKADLLVLDIPTAKETLESTELSKSEIYAAGISNCMEAAYCRHIDFSFSTFCLDNNIKEQKHWKTTQWTSSESTIDEKIANIEQSQQKIYMHLQVR